ncbi:RNA polymerase sigma factor [Paenibacillus alginolyticus]|uniref:RNA polymerase sigma factor n=1 Tax=Paenibacillus alginolyticus TaxID=59839 RepID=UPI0003FF5DC8|nr:RNA polymerase sigma factor [Paenibacillus alginolyticus]MCY9669858.1 RNA polymerase sigma factor [Paenibacillus alginolyticus]
MDEELYRLIYQAKRGEKEAFTALIKRYKGHVYRYALGMLGDQMEAEDAAQEAFIKAYYSMNQLETEYAFSAWIIRIVSNLCKDKLKKRTKEQPLSTENEELNVSYEPTHLRLTIEEAMKHLTPEHREVIILHDIHGYKYDEIAVIADVPVGTVKSRLHAARMALRIEMKKGDEL